MARFSLDNPRHLDGSRIRWLGPRENGLFKHYRGKLTDMAHGNGTVLIDGGPGIYSLPRLPTRLGRFAREVARIKGKIT